MPYPVRKLFDRLRADAAAATQTLLDLATPPLVPALAGNAAPCPGDSLRARGRLPDPAPLAAPDPAAILEEILALTEELERQSRRTGPPTGTQQRNGPLGTLAAAGCLWLEG